MRASLVPLVVAAMLALSGTARAACPIDDPDCGDPGPVISHPTVHLFVDSPSAGTVTDNLGEISCGTSGAGVEICDDVALGDAAGDA